MNIKIVADSSANLTACQSVCSVPLRVITDKTEYVDTAALDVPAMLQDFASYKGRSSTACPGVGDWLAAFEGAEAVLAMTITAELSGSYNAACTARDAYLQDHPEAQIFVLDSRATGPQMELLAEKAKELAASCESFEQFTSELAAYQKKALLLFSLSSLNNFARNGRVSPALAKAVGILGLRIVGMAKDGNLHPMHKPRGDKRAIAQLVSSMQELGWSGGKVRITHTENPEAAAALTARIHALHPACDVAVRHNGGLCCYYCEPGGVLVGFEAE